MELSARKPQLKTPTQKPPRPRHKEPTFGARLLAPNGGSVQITAKNPPPQKYTFTPGCYSECLPRGRWQDIRLWPPSFVPLLPFNGRFLSKPTKKGSKRHLIHGRRLEYPFAVFFYNDIPRLFNIFSKRPGFFVFCFLFFIARCDRVYKARRLTLSAHLSLGFAVEEEGEG